MGRHARRKYAVPGSRHCRDEFRRPLRGSSTPWSAKLPQPTLKSTIWFTSFTALSRKSESWLKDKARIPGRQYRADLMVFQFLSCNRQYLLISSRCRSSWLPAMVETRPTQHMPSRRGDGRRTPSCTRTYFPATARPTRRIQASSSALIGPSRRASSACSICAASAGPVMHTSTSGRVRT